MDARAASQAAPLSHPGGTGEVGSAILMSSFGVEADDDPALLTSRLRLQPSQSPKVTGGCAVLPKSLRSLRN